MTDALCKAILKESGKKIASSGEMDTLRDAQKQYDAALNALTMFNRGNAHKDWAAHKVDLVLAIKDGGNVRDLDAFTSEQFQQQYAVKSEAAREKMRQVCQEILPLCDRICEKFIVIATDFAQSAAAAELEAHTKFGIAHRPSALVVAFGKAAEYARNRCPKSMYAAYSPRQLLPYLEI